jgi:hypothetical protein
LRETIQETSVEAVVTFNKEIFNHVSKDPIDRCLERLIGGDLVQSHIKGIDINVPVFLTFPTGFIFHVNFKQLRKDSLDTIRAAICSGLNVPESKNG